jgi:hypothetical protein
MSLPKRLSRALLFGALALNCGPGRAPGPPPQSEGSLETSPDGGSLVTAPPSRGGVIVPGDPAATAKPSGSGPAGAGTSTGTNGSAVGPTLGTTGGGNN